MTGALRSLVEELEQDRSLLEPDRLRDRVEALDHLEAYLLDNSDYRARALYDRLEAANFLSFTGPSPSRGDSAGGGARCSASLGTRNRPRPRRRLRLSGRVDRRRLTV